jgi:hypothetical protein
MEASPRAVGRGGGGDALREAEHAERELRGVSSASWGGGAGAGAADAEAALKAGLDDIVGRGGNGAEPGDAARLTEQVLASFAAGTEREAKKPAIEFDSTAFMAVAAPAATRGESSGDARSPPRSEGGMEEDASDGECWGGSEEREMEGGEVGYADDGEDGEDGEDGDADEGAHQDGDKASAEEGEGGEEKEGEDGDGDAVAVVLWSEGHGRRCVEVRGMQWRCSYTAIGTDPDGTVVGHCPMHAHKVRPCLALLPCPAPHLPAPPSPALPLDGVDA